jgi:Rieske [2Fe-2S] domain
MRSTAHIKGHPIHPMLVAFPIAFVKGGPLSDGALICGTVQCPWHGSQFDVHTGAVKAGPAAEPITGHPVEVSAGEVRLVPPRG